MPSNMMLEASLSPQAFLFDLSQVYDFTSTYNSVDHKNVEKRGIEKAGKGDTNIARALSTSRVFSGSMMINQDVFDKAMNYLQDEIV